MAAPQISERESNLHAARCHLGEAARRRHHPANKDFYWILLSWVANARRRVVDTTEHDLFGRVCKTPGVE